MPDCREDRWIERNVTSYCAACFSTTLHDSWLQRERERERERVYVCVVCVSYPRPSLALPPLCREEWSGATRCTFSVPIAKSLIWKLHSLITGYNQRNNGQLFTSHMHNDTELVKISAWLSAAVLSYLILKKLQEGHCRLATGTWLYVHVWFVDSITPAQ